MELNDFSALLDVGVTLNIAFVAIEYVKSYTRVLCNQVFKLQDAIEESFNDCMNKLVDEDTLTHIRPLTIGTHNTKTHNTNYLIEDAKRTREKLKKEITDRKEELLKKIEIVCEAKNVSAVSLWLFFFGLAGLFLCGYDKATMMANHRYWSFLSFFTLAYSITGWLSSPAGHNNLFLDFSSLRHTIIWFSISVAVCFVLTASSWLSSIIEQGWNVILISSLIILYSNFIASVVKVWRKAKIARKEVKESSETIQKECDKLQKKVNGLISTNEICNQLEVESEN